MQQFQITLKNEKLRLYSQLSWLIIAIHIIIFLYLGFFSANKVVGWTCIAALGLLAVSFFLRYYLLKTKWRLGLHPFFLLLLLAWINMFQFWLAAIPLIFDILNSISTRKLVVDLSKEKIYYPSFPPKRINWDDLNNVMLKEGLLTIDLKNNKLIQQYADESSTAIDQKEFNDFCQEQLRTAASPI